MHVHHRLRGGEVEARPVSGEELERLRRWLGYFGGRDPERFSEDLALRLEAELGSPAPDLDAVETSLRDGALFSAAARLKRMLESLDGRLPAPDCPKCGKAMRREGAKRAKTFTSMVGKVKVMRSYYRCRGCGETAAPLDGHVRLASKSVTPGLERLLLSVSSEAGSVRAAEMLRELSGIRLSRSRLDREVRRLGSEVSEFERKDVWEPEDGPALPVVGIDGTGVPMRPEETRGRKGKHEGGEAKSRESKLLRICEVERRPDKDSRSGGDTVRAVPGSVTQTAAIDSAQAGPAGGTLSDFGARLRREAMRRGLFHAEEVVVVSDGAAWIENTARQVFAGQRVTFILDLFHVLERLQEALNELIPDDSRRRQVFGRMKALTAGGRAERVIQLIGRHRKASARAAEFAGYCRANLYRMKYGEYRGRGLPVGSGLIEAACRHIVADRLKKSGSRWSKDGANGIMAIRCCRENGRIPDFFEWRAAA